MYLIAISLVIACASASFFTFAAYEVSKNKSLACLGVFSAAYATEQAYIFYNEYRTQNTYSVTDWGAMEDPFQHIVLGAILGQSLWISTLNLFGERKATWKYAPICLFVVMSVLIVATPSVDPSVQKYLFYTLRQLFFLATSILFFIRLRKTEPSPEKSRYRSKAKIMLVFAVLVILVFLEDSFVMLLLADPKQLNSPVIEFIFRRNIAEIVLCLCIAGYSIKYSASVLKARQNVSDPSAANPSCSPQARDSLTIFAKRHSLSAREEEVLDHLLAGETNQQIAQSLQVSLGTVKTHTHNIFKKVGVSNRKDLLSVFWSESL